MEPKKLSKLSFFTNKNIKLFYNIKYPETYIQRLKNKEQIITIEKGKYTLQEDALCYATQIINSSYLSFLSALNYYGYSTQIPQKHTIAIKYNKKEIVEAVENKKNIWDKEIKNLVKYYPSFKEASEKILSFVLKNL